MLNALQNIEVKMYRVNPGEAGFHTKGYIFRQGEDYKSIVGSSNLTSRALTENKEWNMQILSKMNGEMMHDVLTEFEQFWKDALPLDSWIDTYTKIYGEQKQVARLSKQNQVVSFENIH